MAGLGTVAAETIASTESMRLRTAEIARGLVAEAAEQCAITDPDRRRLLEQLLQRAAMEGACAATAEITWNLTERSRRGGA